jgi:hypothetical protein
LEPDDLDIGHKGALLIVVERLELALDSIQRSVLDYWRNARNDLTVPLLDALDPLKLEKRVLPYLVVAEHLDDSGLVHFRLVGEEMVRRWGENFRGRRSDELFTGDYRVFIEKYFALARSERCPVYSESVFRWNDGGWIKTTRLILPFSSTPNGAPTRSVVVQVFLPSEQPQSVPEIRVLREQDMSGGVIVALPGGARQASTPN